MSLNLTLEEEIFDFAQSIFFHITPITRKWTFNSHFDDRLYSRIYQHVSGVLNSSWQSLGDRKHSKGPLKVILLRLHTAMYTVMYTRTICHREFIRVWENLLRPFPESIRGLTWTLKGCIYRVQKYILPWRVLSPRTSDFHVTHTVLPNFPKSHTPSKLHKLSVR